MTSLCVQTNHSVTACKKTEMTKYVMLQSII